MKSLITAATLAAVGLVTPVIANAQDVAAPQGVYGTLGYAYDNTGVGHTDVLQGRLGYRFHPNFAAEGELGVGVGSHGKDGVTSKVKHDEAIYGVGILPVSPNFDLLAKVGYGNTRYKFSDDAANFSRTRNVQSWNFGAGGEYHFDPVNGLRAEYTRKEYTGGPGKADVWSVGYARKF